MAAFEWLTQNVALENFTTNGADFIALREAEGWELVELTGTTNTTIIMIFKRKL